MISSLVPAVRLPDLTASVEPTSAFIGMSLGKLSRRVYIASGQDDVTFDPGQAGFPRSNTATARIGEAVPPRHFIGRPMKVNWPLPSRASRLHRLSMWVMSRSRQAL